MVERITVRRALMSVHDRSGIVEFARALIDAGAEIISSGGTANELRSAGLTVRDVAEVTGSPEMLDGRVKTLHPAIHGGVLADRSNPDHMRTLEERGIAPIDLVVCNLYPFDSQVDAGTPEHQAVELIDVGGPTMVRAAAKNFRSVGVVTDPGDYPLVALEVRAGGLTADTRRRLAAKAFRRLSAYDSAIADKLAGPGFGERITLAGGRIRTLRYGENPHQTAAIYRLGGQPRGVASGEQLQGKELSFINYLDLDAAFRLASAFDEPAAVIIKHTNPCGVAIAADLAEAYRLAFECDPRSAFGGVVGLNRPLTAAVAEQMGDVFLECIVAPGYDDDAREALAKKRNLRLIELPVQRWLPDLVDIRSVTGGLLVQTPDPTDEVRDAMQVVTKRKPSDAEWDDLLFAWTVCSHVKSNAIVLANMRQAVGVGAGQMSRVEAMEIAITRAGDRAKGSVAASDAFFPFGDSVERAGQAGVAAVIQPGGSVRDEESIAAADAAEMAMVFTGHRHFRH